MLLFFSQKHLRCLGSRLVVETAWERYARDESADGTVMLPCYVWSCWGAAAAGRETAERMCGRCCYRGMWSCWGLATVLMLFAAVGGRCCGDEAADDAVTLLFAAVGGIDVRERECGDESADDAVAMLFAAVGGGCWGARLRRRICGRCCYPAICSCWGPGVDVGERDSGDESADDAVTMLFAAVGGRCGGARLRRRICGRCC